MRFCSAGPRLGDPCTNNTTCGSCTAGTTSATDAACYSDADCGGGVGSCNLALTPTPRCVSGTLSLVGALCDSAIDCGTGGLCATGTCSSTGLCRDACGRCN